MRVNADFGVPAFVDSEAVDWAPSPAPGVERRMLDRVGDEVARATSIVRYTPGSRFSEHVHDGGEEFVVLEGTFQDEHGDYPAGTYVRNPPASRHSPRSETGCTIFVKLWQFAPDDRTPVRVDMEAALVPAGDGFETADLHADARERVRYVRLASGADFSLPADGGHELLVLGGGIELEGNGAGRGGWWRLPVGAALDLRAGDGGAAFWIKSGHLAHLRLPEA